MKKSAKILLIITAVFLVILFVFSKRTKDEPDQVVSNEIISRPNIQTSLDTDSLNISFNIEPGSLPERAVVYKLEEKSFSDEEMDAIAQNLNVFGDQFVSDSPITGKTVVYYSGTSRLRILPNDMLIDFKTGTTPSQTPFPDKNTGLLVQAAETFLTSKKLVDKDEIEFDRVNFITISTGGHYEETDSPNVANVSFSKKIEDSKIVGANYENSYASVMFDSNLSVISVQVDRIQRLSPGNTYLLKTITEIRATAPRLAKIQSINNGKYDFSFGLDRFISRIEIDNIELSYIQEYQPTQGKLQPIYILKGLVIFADGTSQSVVLYLPAITEKRLAPL